jgi:hypothetical protein
MLGTTIKTVKMLESFVKDIFRKPFQEFGRILLMSLASQKRRPSNAEGTGKNQLKLSLENMRDAPVFSCCYLLRYHSLNMTSVLENCRE